MKHLTTLALAALLATSGAAWAGSDQPTDQRKIDQTQTSSISSSKTCTPSLRVSCEDANDTNSRTSYPVNPLSGLNLSF
jgi:hypothetical protein